LPGVDREKALKALAASFSKKPKLIPKNEEIFAAAEAWCQANK
jgi:hypothetical protein